MSIRTRTSGIMIPAYVAPVSGGTTLKNGLVSFWDFDDLNDSKNGHNLSWNNKFTSDVNQAGGVAGGNCCHFDGADAAQCLVTGVTPDFNIASNSFSWAGWFKISSLGGQQGVFGRGDSPSGTPSAFLRYKQADAGIYFYIYDATAGVDTAFAAVVPTTGTWHLVVGVCDRDAGFMYISIDDSLLTDGSKAITVGPTDINQILTLGLAPTSSSLNNGDNSYIDNFAFWNRALTQDEVNTYWGGGTGIAYADM